VGEPPAELRRRDRRLASSAPAPTPTSAHLPPEHRRRWLIGTVVTVVLAVAAVVGGPWVYANLTVPAPQDPLELSTQSPSPTVAPGPPAAMDVDGTWTISTGSQGGYRIGEVLSGESVVVAGRTDQVTGTVVVSGGALTTARVVVDTASISTDESARDAYFRRALDTTTFPEATFELSAPVDVSEVGTASGPVTVAAPGTLTLRGVAVPATANLELQRTVSGVEVVASVPLTLADVDLDPPELGFVTVEPTGTIEILLVLVR